MAEGERQGVGERQGFHISKDFEERQGLGITTGIEFSKDSEVCPPEDLTILVSPCIYFVKSYQMR